MAMMASKIQKMQITACKHWLTGALHSTSLSFSIIAESRYPSP
jgi:hypothetical protein